MWCEQVHLLVLFLPLVAATAPDADRPHIDFARDGCFVPKERTTASPVAERLLPMDAVAQKLRSERRPSEEAGPGTDVRLHTGDNHGNSGRLPQKLTRKTTPHMASRKKQGNYVEIPFGRRNFAEPHARAEWYRGRFYEELEPRPH